MPAAIWSGRDGHSEKVTADIAQALGTELGLAQPPLAVTLSADSNGVPAGSLLPPRERFSGMPAPTHCFVHVDAQAPRPFELRAVVMSGRAGLRRSLGLGPLLHAVPIGPPVSARVALSVPRRGSTPPSFEGDNADMLFLVPHPDPGKWAVLTVIGRGQEYDVYEGPAASYLLRILRRELTSQVLPDDFADEEFLIERAPWI